MCGGRLVMVTPSVVAVWIVAPVAPIVPPGVATVRAGG